MTVRRNARRAFRLVAGAGLAAAAYMAFEAQWLATRRRQMDISGLPPALEGLSILHLSDVHAGQPGLNLWTLRKAVAWGASQQPDLVVLTGDILGAGWGAKRCLDLLAHLRPRLGMYAVTGNHEYGLSKNPFAHRPPSNEWERAGVRLLKDECLCVTVDRAPTGAGGAGRPARLVLCGADYLTGGHRLHGALPEDGDLALLLTHRPPQPGDALEGRFAVAFAGHTHGGQIRVPTPWGKVRVHRDQYAQVEGVHPWGAGLAAITTGIGTTFLPFRLATRPEAVLYQLGTRVP